jgi:hypothetical protein
MTNNTPVETSASAADTAPELPVECPHCHEQLPITADFCRRCGQPIERPAPFEGKLPDPATLAPAKPAAPAVEESKALPGTPSLAARLTADPLADGSDVPVDAVPTDLLSRRLTPIVLLVSTVLGFVVSLAAGANRLRSPDEIGAVLGWTAVGTVVFAIAGLLGCLVARRVWRRSSAGLVGGMVAVLVLTIARCLIGAAGPKRADAIPPAAQRVAPGEASGRPVVPGVNWSRRGGRWRSIQDAAGRSVYDFVTDAPKTFGGPVPPGQRALPASELPNVSVSGSARGDVFEFLARNDSDWDVEQVTFAVTVWERPQVSRTYYLAHAIHLPPRSTASIEAPIPEPVPSEQTRIDFTVRAAAGHTP